MEVSLWEQTSLGEAFKQLLSVTGYVIVDLLEKPLARIRHC